MVYMSRSLIEKKNINNKSKVFKQVCIYGFNLYQLKKFYSYE